MRGSAACEQVDACIVTDMNTMRLLFAVKKFAVKKKQHDKDKGEIERESGGRKIGIDGNIPTDRHTNSK